MRQLTFLNDDDWPVPPTPKNSVFIGTLPSPIWTETKAKLIAEYLKLFLFITRHGTYIDGFSGPQDVSNDKSWAAKLVLELEPDWLKDFYLCEINRESFRKLDQLVSAQPEKATRKIVLHHGDFNDWIDEMLQSSEITDKTAAFALLDQRSCECHWRTVNTLAGYKQGDTKIELFYFFPTGWVHRSISGFADTLPLDAWWGDDGWRQIPNVSQDAAARLMTERIQKLGYADVKAWPIYEAQDGGRVMYHMIHATDHKEAPRLMYRAYKKLIAKPDEQEQMTM